MKKGLIWLGGICLLAAAGCGPETETADSGDVKDQLADIESASDGADLVLGSASISLDTGRLAIYRFRKQAGADYTVTLSTTRGDLDLYGHWRRDFEPWSGTLSSRRSGRYDDEISFTAESTGDYYVLVHAYRGGSGRLLVDEVAPERPAMRECRACRNANDCQAMIDDLVAEFPDFSASERSITFAVGNPSTYCDSMTWGRIRCPQGFIDRGIVTNKLLFHELNHHMKQGNLDNSGSPGQCSRGGCNSSELQASLLEEHYFPVDCLGGHYTFTDINGVRRASRAILDVLQGTSVTISEMWDFAMGRRNALADHAGAFGLRDIAHLYYSQTY